MRYAISAIAAGALAILVCAHPARASITSASITTKTPTVSGKCPTAVSFTGTIVGTPGTTFTYSFNRFIDGTQQVVTIGSAAIPASSTYAVSDSIPISAATSGRTFDQIWVHNIAGGQSDVYSNEVPFTVTCGLPPKPTPKPTPQPARLPYPTKLKNTVDAKVCGQHGGLAGLFCPSALHGGYLVLVWNYKAEGRIDGYHVYETGIAYYKKVDTQDNAQATLAFLKPVTGGFGGRCYQVRAYKGKDESRLSNMFCVPEKYKYTGPPAVTQVLELAPTNSECRWHDYDYGVGGDWGLGCSPIAIGYAHQDSGWGPWLSHENTDWQSEMLFPQSSIKGLKVWKATLELTLPKYGESYNCYGSLGMATQPWVGGTSWVSGDFTSHPTTAHFVHGQQPSIDVTGVVKAWAAGKATNYGFVTRSSDENFGAEENNYCFLYFEDNPVLRIEHY